MSGAGMDHTFEVEPGVQLHYVVDDFTDPWQPAETLVLVHGLAESAEAWRAWVPHLSRHYRLVPMQTLFLLAGYGGARLQGTRPQSER